ncbi:hypothetical protein GCM10023322_46570 [Rugosimonospora acidiphila]|uniref:Uncharacterized protein n=1 Tax=Rugosimonospora acidiphila TaxID=556531 RepID=A0ABP9S5D1_9ACTN
MQVLVAQEVDHVGDVDVEVGVRARQVGAFTQAGQAQRVHLVAEPTQSGGDRTPGPRAEPESGNEYECCHAPDARVNTGQIPPD